RPFLADHLADLKFAQLAHHPRPEREAHEQRGQARGRRAERDVLRHVQHRDLRVERIEQVEQHQPRSAFTRPTTRSVFTPRSPFTRPTPPPGASPTMESAAESLVAKCRAADAGSPAATAACAIACAGAPPTVNSTSMRATAAARPTSSWRRT